MAKKATKSKSPINIFELTKAADTCDTGFYSRLSDDAKKAFVPWTAMIWVSSVNDKGLAPHVLDLVNEYVNKNFSSLTKHPELLWKLMTVQGVGSTYKHMWPGVPKGKKKSKIQKFLSSVYPSYSLDDLKILERLNTKEDLIQLAKEYGYDDKEIKELFK